MCRGTLVLAITPDLQERSPWATTFAPGASSPILNTALGSGKATMSTALASKMSTAPSSKASGASGALRVLSVIVAVVGAFFLVVGVTMYAITSSQLGAQKVTVANLNEGTNDVANGAFAGKAVADPFTALAQIGAIGHHMQQASARATGGKSDAVTGVVTGGNTGLTYGTAPAITLLADGTCKSAINWTDPAGNGTFQCAANSKPVVTGGINAAALSTVRSTFQSGSLLVASLYVSVLAFGVSALAAGLGVVLIIIAAVQMMTVRTLKADAIV